MTHHYERRRPSGPTGSAGPSAPVGPVGRRLSGPGLGFTPHSRMALSRPSIQTIASVGSLEGREAEDFDNIDDYRRYQGRRQSRHGSIWNQPRTKSMPRLSIYSLGALEFKEDDDLRCGYFGWKPDFLQVINTPGFLLAALAFFNACQGYMINGTLNQITSTLERRFDLSTTQVSLINTSYDIFYGLFVLPLGFMATFKYKPRILGIGALLLALGAFIFVVPHLVAGEYALGTVEWDFTCNPYGNTTDPLCGQTMDSNLYMLIFCFAQFFNAMGGVTLQVVAIPMLDENIKSKQLPLYQGINQGVNMLGPAFAATIGSRFLNIYVDVGRVDMEDVVLENTDPAWVGAWWIGFLIAGFMLIISACILFLFSYETPAAKRNAKFRFQEAHEGKGLRETRNENFGARIMEIPYSIKLLLSNPVVLVSTIVATLEIGTVSGLNMFMAKFLQFQFSLTPANASVILGAVLLPGAVMGLMIGGFIAKKFELKIPGLMKMNIATGALAIPLSLVFLLKCDKLQLAGIYAPYGNSTSITGSLDDVCNLGCSCSLREYKPACGLDNKVYFSPCHAGCLDEHLFKEDDDEQYFDCSCVNIPSPSWDVGQVEVGVCDTACTEMYIFLAVFFFLVLTQFFGGSTAISALLRSVPEKERTMAIAVQQLFTRYLGMVPFPFLLAAIFDNACEVYQMRCGEKGACWVYDSDFLAMGLAIWVVVIKIISTSMYFLGIKFYKPPPKEVADPTNIASNEEILSIYSRHGSVASIVFDLPPAEQKISRLDTIGEDEEAVPHIVYNDAKPPVNENGIITSESAPPLVMTPNTNIYDNKKDLHEQPTPSTSTASSVFDNQAFEPDDASVDSGDSSLPPIGFSPVADKNDPESSSVSSEDSSAPNSFSPGGAKSSSDSSSMTSDDSSAPNSFSFGADIEDSAIAQSLAAISDAVKDTASDHGDDSSQDSYYGNGTQL